MEAMTGLVRLECVECHCVFETLNPPLDFIEYAICPTCEKRVREGCEDVTETSFKPNRSA